MRSEFLARQRKILIAKQDEYRALAADFRVGGNLPDRIRFKFHVLLPAVTRALEKIGLGIYNVCDECEESIPLRRLELVPAATHCVGCQEARDVRAA